MTKRSLPLLIFVNVALLAALAVTSLGPSPARAQFGGGSQFIAISGATVLRNDQDAIYVLDIRTGAMIAFIYDSARDEIQLIDGTRISDDLQKDMDAGRR